MSNISILAFRDYEFIAAAVIFLYFKGNILGDILNAFSSININLGISCNKSQITGHKLHQKSWNNKEVLKERYN